MAIPAVPLRLRREYDTPLTTLIRSGGTYDDYVQVLLPGVQIHMLPNSGPILVEMLKTNRATEPAVDLIINRMTPEQKTAVLKGLGYLINHLGEAEKTIARKLMNGADFRQVVREYNRQMQARNWAPDMYPGVEQLKEYIIFLKHTGAQHTLRKGIRNMSQDVSEGVIAPFLFRKSRRRKSRSRRKSNKCKKSQRRKSRRRKSQRRKSRSRRRSRKNRKSRKRKSRKSRKRKSRKSRRRSRKSRKRKTSRRKNK